MRTPHDFRRTAIRNLERSGVSRSAAMAMVGHQTEAVYRRYAIVEERMLSEAGAKRKSSRFPVWPVSHLPRHRRGTTMRRCRDGCLDPAGPFHDSAMCPR
jgi:hypothetical protein